MAVTLTSTGIQFPDSSTQSTQGNPINVVEYFTSSTTASYTISSIPDFTKLTAIFKVSYVSGPSNPSLIAKNTSSNYTGTLTGGNSVFYGSGSSVLPTTLRTTGAQTNFFSGTSYATFTTAKLELFKVSTGKYFYKCIFCGGNNSNITVGNGILTMNSTNVTELYLSGANGGWGTIYAKVYWE